MIDRLEANGWVQRRAERRDRRVKRVYLTPEAERVHRRIWHVAEATVDDALADLSAQESAQLMQLLSRVKKTLVSVVEEGRTNGNGGTAPRIRAPRENGRAAP
jgi:DNA-binding MarR family transcriptional regulator